MDTQVYLHNIVKGGLCEATKWGGEEGVLNGVRMKGAIRYILFNQSHLDPNVFDSCLLFSLEFTRMILLEIMIRLL